MNAEVYKASMEHETAGKKCGIAIGSVVHLAFAAALAAVYTVWWMNSSDIQEASETVCKNTVTISTEC